ncbi:hypothetical protein [Halalkalicoccus tibetensis]|uniref:Uncharacterized protein n=1 Tax=Halalkalicoccus tibetensis TaxID=175632 RepID=A0ABD5V8E3_9EURY
MATTTTDQRFDQSQLPALLGTLSTRLEEFETSITDGSDDETVAATAEELWTILEEAIDVIETIDFEGLSDAIDAEALPEAIDADRLADALETGDATEVLDLAALYEAVDLRMLWQAVDVPALRKEEHELQAEIDSFLGNDESEDESSESDESVLDETARSLAGAESRQQLLQAKIGAAIDAFRTALLAAHLRSRRLYEANRRSFDRSGSRNPSLTATMPRGPLPASASTRVSTVPTRARHSHTKGRPRIYGRRFERVRR